MASNAVQHDRATWLLGALRQLGQDDIISPSGASWDGSICIRRGIFVAPSRATNSNNAQSTCQQKKEKMWTTASLFLTNLGGCPRRISGYLLKETSDQTASVWYLPASAEMALRRWKPSPSCLGSWKKNSGGWNFTWAIPSGNTNMATGNLPIIQ